MDIFDVEQVRFGLIEVPKGIEIPTDTPVMIESYQSVEGTTAFSVYPYGLPYPLKNVVDSTSCHYYVREKFWDPDPYNESDHSDRVLVNDDGIRVMRVVRQGHTSSWVVIRDYDVRSVNTLREITSFPNWAHLHLKFETIDHRREGVA